MIKAIERFYNKRIRPASGVTSAEASDQALKLATAALLIEISRADGVITPEENEMITNAVKATFSLTGEETEEIIRMAEDEVKEAVSFYQFTHLINKGFSYEKKLLLIEMLWRVVFADSEMEKHEEYFVRKVADLLHVSHRELIKAKESAGNAQ